MPSVQSFLFTAFLRLIRLKKLYESAAGLRRSAEQATPSSETLRRIRALVSVEGDSPREGGVVRLTPKDSGSTHILYIHGGGWVFPARKQHWLFLAWLANETSAGISAALYPLAPAHAYCDVMAFLLPVYRDLIDRHGTHLIVIGDSAGGNIALSLLQEAHGKNLRMPTGLVLIAPAVDATFSNPEQEILARSDPMLALDGLRAAGTWYAGDLRPDDSRISPLRSSLSHLPCTQLFIGTNDLLLPDVRLFRDKALREGVNLEYHEAPGMMHVWPLIQFLPEARVARRQMVRFIEEAISERL